MPCRSPAQTRPTALPECSRALLAEDFLEEARHRDLVLAVGPLFRRTVRIGEAVRGAAVDLELPIDLGGAKLLDQGIDLGERRHGVFGAVQDEDAALDVLGRLG